MSHKHRDHSYPPAPEPLPVAVYDNHTHIEPWLEDVLPASTEDPHTRPGADTDNAPADWHAQLDLAAAVGVRGIVQAGTTLATSRWAAAHAERDVRMLAGVAIHPNEVPSYAAAGILDDALAELDGLAAHDRVRVVGETGLDFHYTEAADFDRQIRSFEQHIEIAKAHGIALQIHDRDAHAEVVATLRRVGAPERTVFHCFSGDAELGRVCAEHGWYASFSGTVTFKNAEDVRAGLRELPPELVLVETDAPYLTPMPYRGRPNAPYLLPNTVRFIADHLGVPLDEFCAQTVTNTERVYGAWA